MLRYGANAVLDTVGVETKEMDIDEIISKSTTVTYKTADDSVQNKLSSFSKVTRCL
ncbi:MAG: hypothetical protein ACK419_02970 [Pyrinomonadaceae bacterium]